MKALVVCSSIHHGNTEKIAKAMAGVLKARLARAGEIKPEELKEFDLVGFGSGIYYARHHSAILKLAETNGMAGKKVFIFSTSGLPAPLNKTFQHIALRRRLLKNGAQILGEFSARGFDTNGALGRIGGINKGKPDEADASRAEAFARKIREKFLAEAVAYGI